MMECPKCGFKQTDQQTECMRCGVIFDKYHRRMINTPETDPSVAVHAEPVLSPGKFIKELLFYIKPETNPLIFSGRALFFLIIFIWGLIFIKYPGKGFDDLRVSLGRIYSF